LQIKCDENIILPVAFITIKLCSPDDSVNGKNLIAFGDKT
jgi:hypothetical protein